jgi:hypothetical protein
VEESVGHFAMEKVGMVLTFALLQPFVFGRCNSKLSLNGNLSYLGIDHFL